MNLSLNLARNLTPTEIKKKRLTLLDDDVPSATTLDADEYEEVTISRKPSQDKWRFIPIFKRDNKDMMRVWQIGFNGKENLVIWHGLNGGAIQVDYPPIELNSTGRDFQEQAWLEAFRRYENKFKEGYQPAGATEPPMTKPMKGEVYDDEKQIKQFPVGSLMKLDGVRCLIDNIGAGKVKARSSKNNDFGHLTHIVAEMIDFMPFLPAYATCDCEIYRHGWSLQYLRGVVKTIKTVHPELTQVKAHIFDIIYSDNPPYEVRHKLLLDALKAYKSSGKENKYFEVIDMDIAHNHEELLSLRDKYLADGYEGSVIRRLANGAEKGTLQYQMSQYHPGRSNRVMKYKPFQDEEAVIVSVESPKGREAGKALFKVRDKRGRESQIRPCGSFEQREDWFNHPQEVVGRKVTVRFNGYTQDFAWQFPRAIAIRDYEGAFFESLQ